jgi:hypothetical protein
MIRNSLIAFSAATIMGLGLASAAEAKTNISLNINLGFGGFCHHEYVPYKKWNAWHTAYTIKFRKVLVCG